VVLIWVPLVRTPVLFGDFCCLTKKERLTTRIYLFFLAVIFRVLMVNLVELIVFFSCNVVTI